MSMASEVMKLTFAVSDVSFNSGHYTVIIKRQFLYINNTKQHYVVLLLRVVVHNTHALLSAISQNIQLLLPLMRKSVVSSRRLKFL